MITIVATQPSVSLIILIGIILYWISSNREKWGREKYSSDERKALFVLVFLVGSLLAIRFSVLMFDWEFWTFLIAEGYYTTVFNVSALAVLFKPTLLYIAMLSYGRAT